MNAQDGPSSVAGGSLNGSPGNAISWLATDQGPTDHAPAGGCPKCGSHKIFDCNAEVEMELSAQDIAAMVENGWQLVVALPPVHPKCQVMTETDVRTFVGRLQPGAGNFMLAAKIGSMMARIVFDHHTTGFDARRN